MRVFLSGFVLVILLGYFIFYIITNDADAESLQRMSIQTVVVQVTGDLDRAMPLINEAGYKMSALSVKSSLPPLIIASFSITKNIPYEKQEQILSSLKDNAIGQMVLQGLIQAFELDNVIEIEKKELKTIRLFLTIPPAVQVEYR